MPLPNNKYTNTHNFHAGTSIPALTNRVIIVTGGNAGIGKQTVLELSRHSPQRIYLAARSRAKYDAAVKDILAANPSAAGSIEFLELDLASIASVRRAANDILARPGARLDLLINNAGVMGVPAGLTRADVEENGKGSGGSGNSGAGGGYEMHFGTNYMGPAALTKLLMPLMQRTAALPGVAQGSVRVVHVSSGAAVAGLVGSGKLDWNTLRTTRADIVEYRRYAISKLAQVLYARESAERWAGVVHVAVHPGRVDTGLLDGFMAKPSKRWSLMGTIQRVFDSAMGKFTVEQGAATSLWAATWDGKGLQNGRFYTPVGVLEEGDSKCKDEKLRKELWEWTEGELKRFGI